MNGVNDHIVRLVVRGYLQHTAGTARGIKVLLNPDGTPFKSRLELLRETTELRAIVQSLQETIKLGTHNVGTPVITHT